MSASKNPLLSVVVPVYNEASGLEAFHTKLIAALAALCGDAYELLYCDDGSTDNTPTLVRQWHQTNPHVSLLCLSRNFGKESALSAGIAVAHGQAILTLDGDGQHPIDLIPEFLASWKTGARVVIGVRRSSKSDSKFKRLGSRLFYTSFNKLTAQKLLPGSTDFRLIDRSVQQAFLQLPETDRITRGLIDWLGFKRQLIYFQANARESGSPMYGKRKLITLATTSFVSLTPTPLYVFGYLGIFITLGSFCLGLAVFIEQLLFNDPWHWKFSGTAMLGILILFLVGIVLMSQGILSLYISHIQEQSRRRPLYVIDHEASAGIENNTRVG